MLEIVIYIDKHIYNAIGRDTDIYVEWSSSIFSFEYFSVKLS